MDFEQLQTLSIFAPPKKFLPHKDLSEKRKKNEAGRLSKVCRNWYRNKATRLDSTLAWGSVTASFGHYHRSGSTYVVLDLHGKNSYVDPELSCGQDFFCRQIRWRNILSTKFRQNISGSICLVPDLYACRSGSIMIVCPCRSGSTWLDCHIDPDLHGLTIM